MVPASDSDPGIVKVDFYLGLTTEYEIIEKAEINI